MNFRQLRPLLLACTALAASGAVTPLLAQQAESAATELNTIQVKGKRVANGTVVSGSPQTSAVSGADLQKKDVGSFQDLGRTLEPGVDFVKAQGGVTIRGLGGPRIQTNIDGIPIPYLSNDARAGGPSTATNANGGSDAFDFSSLGGVDILRGADSSRLGGGALGGGVVLRTLEPEDLIGGGKDWGAFVRGTYDSRDRSFGGSAAGAKKIDNTSILFQGAYKKGHEVQNNGSVDALGAARTEANPGDLTESNMLFKLRQDLEGGHRIGITGERFRRDFENELKTLQGATTGSSRVYAIDNYYGFDDSARDRVSLDYRFLSPDENSVIQSAQATLYWQKLVKNAGAFGARVGTYNGPWLRDNELEDTTIGFSGNVVGQFDTGSLHHEVTLGGDIASFNTSQFLTGVDACTLGRVTAGCASLHSNQADMPEVDGRRFGIFLDDKISFGDSGFALTPGIRFDWYDYDPKLTAEYQRNPGYAVGGLPAGSDGSRFSPKLLATYQLTPEVELFAQWAMAYRAPTVNELYLNFANPASGYAVVGNPTLKPETANGFEVGANFDAGDFFGRVTAFHNRYKNFIDTVSLPGNINYPMFIQSNVNRANVTISGFEVNATKTFSEGFYVRGALAYAYGEDTDTGAFIRSVAPLKGVLAVGVDKETWGADLSFTGVSGMRNDNVASTFDAPGYGLFDLAAWWEPEQAKGLRVQAGIYNIFDKTYYNAVGVKDISLATAPAAGNSAQLRDFYSEPGRTFKISITQRF